MSNLNVDDLKKLVIQDGDILVVPESANYEEVRRLAESIRTAKGVMVVCGPLDKLSEQDMNAAGWYRK